MMSKPGKNERRHSATLPVTTAATAQQARNTANAVISSVLQQAVPPRQEAEEKMETGLSGTAAAPMQMSGSGTAGSGSNEPTQEGSGTAGPSRPPAAAKAVYRNYHSQEYGISNLGSGSGNNSGTGNATILTTARYKNIQTQRQLRGEHTPIGSGPAADSFKCGDIFLEGDSRNSQAVLHEDNRELMVTTSSFIHEDWTCISCSNSHPLLPKISEKEMWSGGRKLIFLTDHNMPAVLPSLDGKCPIIVRMDGGLLREIGTNFLSRLRGYSIPEGSVIVIGSVTHLMEEGRVGYSKGLVTEFIRLTKAFKGTIHVVPFLPPPSGRYE